VVHRHAQIIQFGVLRRLARLHKGAVCKTALFSRDLVVTTFSTVFRFKVITGYGSMAKEHDQAEAVIDRLKQRRGEVDVP
jgi:hypothetical protein